MKFEYWSRFLPLLSRDSRVRVQYFSTKTLSSTSVDSLYKRISLIADPKVSIIPALDKWIEEDRTIKKEELRSLLTIMKNYRRFQHALEISLWMTDRRYFTLTPTDVAIRLDLIFKVHGLEQAEKYFNIISKQLKASQPYGVLLNCYVTEKSVEKAEALVQEMKKMGFVTNSYTYNILVNLYAQTGEYEKIDILMEEMERKGIPQDRFTINNRLNAYVAASDIDGMENFLNQMEGNPSILVDWNAYTIVTNGYLKVGSIDKALATLKKIEEMTINRSTKKVLEYLISLYASARQKDEMYRIWYLYRSAGRVLDISYACMITSLSKLDDIEGAEKIFEDWESSCTTYDFRVLNRLIVAYCKKGLLEKAESVVKMAVEKIIARGRTPFASTWMILAIGYLEDKQILKAVEMSKKAMSLGRRGWKPNSMVISSCLVHFEEKGDVEEAEAFVKLLGASGSLTRDVYHRLLRTYVAANKPISNVLDRMKLDGLSADEETHKIVEQGSDL